MNYLLNLPLELKPINPNLENILTYIDQHKKLSKMKALEIGAGICDKSIPLSNKFKTYYTLEMDTPVFDICKSKMMTKFENNIKPYNMDLFKFINKLIKYNSDASHKEKKFDLIIGIYIIHYFNFDEFIKKIKIILKSNAYVIIEVQTPIPYGWGQKKLNKNDPEFNEEAWNKLKNKLEEANNKLSLSEYFISKTGNVKTKSGDAYKSYIYLLRIP